MVESADAPRAERLVAAHEVRAGDRVRIGRLVYEVVGSVATSSARWTVTLRDPATRELRFEHGERTRPMTVTS